MATWRKSSHSESTSTQSDCVEVADLGQELGIRDSKAPHTPHLTLTPAAFDALLVQAKRNELNL
ncbi:uncharacterized protein DUF397 [Actinomadura pelletieri DSM 43383]|uniref:Uncharacterized protein DUF397 n=1 Tax=Actinomadura pelletieri DSM 43383 TaxID=1120940 RepID=A0A495R0F3_9ACTN|nr:DUF397 domain-containing protein [Actinomadura pelletieri]RKS79817.1 uncharacterized protein DUF397 [Actinomadura pelletieri DSM 43383]